MLSSFALVCLPCVFINVDEWKVKRKCFCLTECGSVVNNTLTSPGYPNSYPPNMDCNYSIPVPPGMMMEIDFHEFNLEFSFQECL